MSCKGKEFLCSCVQVGYSILIGLLLKHFTMRLYPVFGTQRGQIKQCPNRSLQVWGTHILELGLLLFHSEVWFNRINQIIGPASPTSQVCFHLDNALCFLILHNNPEDLKTADLGLLQSTFLARMDEISRIFGTIGRERSDSYSTQSTGSKLLLRHRLNQLMTCVDDLDPKTELHEKMIKTLDNAFLVCGKRAHKPKKDSFRWRTDATLYRNDIPYLLFSLLLFSLTCLIVVFSPCGFNYLS